MNSWTMRRLIWSGSDPIPEFLALILAGEGAPRLAVATFLAKLPFLDVMWSPVIAPQSR
jgi:hypothetical protein